MIIGRKAVKWKVYWTVEHTEVHLHELIKFGQNDSVANGCDILEDEVEVLTEPFHALVAGQMEMEFLRERTGIYT